MKLDNYLEREEGLRHFYNEDTEVTFDLEIWDDYSYVVYERDLQEDDLDRMLKLNGINVKSISHEHVSICFCEDRQLNIQITPNVKVNDPSDI